MSVHHVSQRLILSHTIVIYTLGKKWYHTICRKRYTHLLCSSCEQTQTSDLSVEFRSSSTARSSKRRRLTSVSVSGEGVRGEGVKGEAVGGYASAGQRDSDRWSCRWIPAAAAVVSVATCGWWRQGTCGGSAAPEAVVARPGSRARPAARPRPPVVGRRGGVNG